MTLATITLFESEEYLCSKVTTYSRKATGPRIESSDQTYYQLETSKRLFCNAWCRNRRPRISKKHGLPILVQFTLLRFPLFYHDGDLVQNRRFTLGRFVEIFESQCRELPVADVTLFQSLSVVGLFSRDWWNCSMLERWEYSRNLISGTPSTSCAGLGGGPMSTKGVSS